MHVCVCAIRGELLYRCVQMLRYLTGILHCALVCCLVLRHLAQGYTSYSSKAGDFRYGFYLWFENEQGEKLTPQKELGLIQDALDANFFRQLKIRYSYMFRSVHQ